MLNTRELILEVIKSWNVTEATRKIHSVENKALSPLHWDREDDLDFICKSVPNSASNLIVKQLRAVCEAHKQGDAVQINNTE